MLSSSDTSFAPRENGLRHTARAADGATAEQQTKPPRQPYEALRPLRSRLEAVDTQLEVATHQCEMLLHDERILHDRDVERDVRHLRARLEGLHRQITEAVSAMNHLARPR